MTNLLEIFFIIYLLAIIGISIFGLVVLVPIKLPEKQSAEEFNKECNISYDKKNSLQNTFWALIGINVIFVGILAKITFFKDDVKKQQKAK